MEPELGVSTDSKSRILIARVFTGLNKHVTSTQPSKLANGHIESGEPGASTAKDGINEMQLPTLFFFFVARINPRRSAVLLGTLGTLRLVSRYSPAVRIQARSANLGDPTNLPEIWVSEESWKLHISAKVT